MSTNPSGPGRSILVVEDNFDAREALRALLELDGHTVAVAEDGEEALDVARAKHPDVALIDIGLPGMDGYEVARRIRAQPGPKPVLIALTGYAEPEDRARAAEAGFHTHLTKPIEPGQLSQMLLSLEIPGRGSRG